MKIIKTFLFLMCAVVITPAQATTIYSQGWDGTTQGMSSTWDTNPDTNQKQNVASVTDLFSLAPSISKAYVNNIGWWGGFNNSSRNTSPNDFYIELGTLDSIGTPTELTHFYYSVTGVAESSVNGLVAFYSLDLFPIVELMGGVNYYISIQADSDVDISNLQSFASTSWFWAYDTSNPGNAGGFTYTNEVEFPDEKKIFDRHAAFVLNGSVPEPATIWLMMLALAVMVVVRRRSVALEA